MRLRRSRRSAVMRYWPPCAYRCQRFFLSLRWLTSAPAASADSFVDTTPGTMAFAVPAGVDSLSVAATGGARWRPNQHLRYDPRHGRPGRAGDGPGRGVPGRAATAHRRRQRRDRECEHRHQRWRRNTRRWSRRILGGRWWWCDADLGLPGGHMPRCRHRRGWRWSRVKWLYLLQPHLPTPAGRAWWRRRRARHRWHIGRHRQRWERRSARHGRHGWSRWIGVRCGRQWERPAGWRRRQPRPVQLARGRWRRWRRCLRRWRRRLGGLWDGPLVQFGGCRWWRRRWRLVARALRDEPETGRARSCPGDRADLDAPRGAGRRGGGRQQGETFAVCVSGGAERGQCPRFRQAPLRRQGHIHAQRGSRRTLHGGPAAAGAQDEKWALRQAHDRK